MAPDQTNLLQGTLDMMILKSLASQKCTAWVSPAASSKSPRERFKSSLARFSRLYIAWKNKGGWSLFGRVGNNRRAKYYKLTSAVRRQLETETKRWGRIVLAMTRTLEASREKHHGF